MHSSARVFLSGFHKVNNTRTRMNEALPRAILSDITGPLGIVLKNV